MLFIIFSEVGMCRLKVKNMVIPKIIHQIWSGIDGPLPDFLKDLGNTWKEHHREWKYELWDHKRINDFVLTYYPQYFSIYEKFPFNIQRWDVIRYLILSKMGGLYVDLDTECLATIDELLDGHTCCFSMEDPSNYNMDFYFNNALMASVPNHPFMNYIIDNVFSFNEADYEGKSKGDIVMNSTGPLMLIKLYNQYPNKELIHLIPFEYVSPVLKEELIIYYEGKATNILKKKLQAKLENAYSVHYFFNTWLHGVDVESLSRSYKG